MVEDHLLESLYNHILQVFCHLICEMHDHRSPTWKELLDAFILLLNLEMALSHLKIITIIMHFHSDSQNYLKGFSSYLLTKAHAPVASRWALLGQFYTWEGWGTARAKPRSQSIHKKKNKNVGTLFHLLNVISENSHKSQRKKIYNEKAIWLIPVDFAAKK